MNVCKCCDMDKLVVKHLSSFVDSIHWECDNAMRPTASEFVLNCPSGLLCYHRDTPHNPRKNTVWSIFCPALSVYILPVYHICLSNTGSIVFIVLLGSTLLMKSFHVDLQGRTPSRQAGTGLHHRDCTYHLDRSTS
jgi:hypothetical protein